MQLIRLQGRLTRKIMLIFLIFALLPTVLLAFYTVDNLANEARRQAMESLEYQVELFSHKIFNSLQSATNTMQNADLATEPTIQQHKLNNMAADIPHLSSNEQQRLLRGESVLLNNQDTLDATTLYLLSPVEWSSSEATVRSMLLNEALVFGEPDTWDLSVDYCIFDDARRLLYATHMSVCNATMATNDHIVLGHKGHYEFQAGHTSYVSSYRSLFLKNNYGIEPWWLVLSKPTDDLFSGYRLFQMKFIGLATLVVLILTLTSLWMIRKLMTPLPDIMSGIKRVIQRDYSQEVEVQSGDEFEELADAFNFMSDQVSRQLRTQASLSDIDQLILSRVKKEDIVTIVLEKTREIVPHDDIAMILLEEDDKARLYRSGIDAGNASANKNQPLDRSELQTNLARSGTLWDTESNEAPPPWLAKIIKSEFRYIMALPVNVEGKLVAIVCFGFLIEPYSDEESENLLTTYANRIAVALANAEWEDRLYQQAHYDALTALPNRPAMQDMLRQTINQSHREELSFAVLFVDLDDFKLINDSLGHSVGDELIKILATRFRSQLRSSDTVFRLGGDEFVVISRTCSDPESAADVARRIAVRLLKSINQSAEINSHEILSSGSIGISLYAKDGTTSEALLKNADTAMYHAKGLRKGQHQFYAEELNAESIALVQLATDINNAMDADEFELYYQPKVNVGDFSIIGGEALIRWNHPKRGLITPGQFIAKAERLGLITRIDDWALRTACMQLAQWQEINPNLRISVNISALQIRDGNLDESVRNLLSTYQVPGHMLELEVTESVLLEDIDKVSHTLAEIRRLGVQVSIDDYGTGYSSLSYMKHLQADVLKIDRAFITNLHHNKADQAIVHSTITLAHDLGMKVIAEGVETSQQLERLVSYDCDEIQGFYFSKPVPSAEFEQLINSATSTRIQTRKSPGQGNRKVAAGKCLTVPG